MSDRYYRLLPVFAASLLLLSAGCSGSRAVDQGPAATAQAAASPAPREVDTEANIWTVLGLAKKPSQRALGPAVGDSVSPVLWQAAHDALDFVKITSEDPWSGVLMTDWYSPPRHPNERLRISVFILSRALRSDSLSVTIDREERGPGGQWKPSTIARDTVVDLENAILLRARHLHAERYLGAS